MKQQPYLWSVPFGLYYYALFQLVHRARSGAWKMPPDLADAGLVLIGIASVAAYVYFVRKGAEPKRLLVALLVALPVSLYGAFLGVPLGLDGILVYGLVPFAVALPLGHWFLKREMGGN